MLLILLSCVSVAGCTSARERRIENNMEYLSGLDPQTQAEIRRGEVRPGHSMKMVEIALGRPDRETTRRTEADTVVLWSYIGVHYDTERRHVIVDVPVRDKIGRTRYIPRHTHVDVQTEYEHEHVRVEFTNGIVTAIEETRD